MLIDHREQGGLVIVLLYCVGALTETSSLPVGPARELGLEANNDPTHSGQGSGEEAGRRLG